MAKPRRRSRFLTVLLCLCLLANLVPVQAMAAGADMALVRRRELESRAL